MVTLTAPPAGNPVAGFSLYDIYVDGCIWLGLWRWRMELPFPGGLNGGGITTGIMDVSSCSRVRLPPPLHYTVAVMGSAHRLQNS